MWEWEQQGRFEEIGSDESEGEDVPVPRHAGPPRRHYGYDVQSSREPSRRESYEDLAYGDSYELEDEDYYDEGGEMQVALRQKEEELVESALRRINRARIKGEGSVGLTREEIDALERRQLIPAANTSSKPSKDKTTRSGTGSRSTSAKPKKRSGGGIFSLGGQPAKPKNPKGEKKAPLALPEPPSSRRGSDQSSPDHISPPQRPDTPSGGYFAGVASRPTSSPSKALARNGSRGVSSGARPHQSPPTPPQAYDPRYYPAYGEAAHRPPSSRGSPTRSLPDDPDWQPRPRSRTSSSTQLHAPDPFAYQVPPGQQQYPGGRRNVSGPPQVSYSGPRRSIPPGGGGAPRMPTSSSDPSMMPRGSGLSQEVLDFTDSNEETGEDDDEESDEGVRVPPEASASGYMVRAPPGAAQRRGGRR